MLFHQPWLLLGLGLCVLPVLIHRLSRRAEQRESWAAMQFLRAALDRRAKQLRIESRLLLLCRMLLLALIVFAAAEPLVTTPNSPAAEPPSVRRIVVLDLSAGMGRKYDADRGIDRARREVAALLDAARPGDSFRAVRIAATPPRAMIRRETFDVPEVRAELDRWPLTEEHGDVGGTLAVVLDLLREDSAAERSEVVIVSDLQRANWLPDDPVLRTGVQRQLTAIAERADLRWIDVGSPPTADLGLTDLRAARTFVAPQQEIEAAATIRNYGATPMVTRLEWWIDGRLLDSDDVTAAAASTVEVRQSMRAGADVAVEIEARLVIDDALAVNNRRLLVVPIRDAVRVLLVDGRNALRAIDGAAGYLATALAPRGSVVRAGQIPLLCEVPAEGLPAEQDLTRADVIWLCDPARLDATVQRKLEEFVRRGGGLVLSVGDQTNPEQWNAWRTSNGEGLLPCQFQAATDIVEGGEATVGFALSTLPHPVAAPFLGNPQAGLGTTRIRRRMAVADLDAGVRRVVDFSDGPPAIVERTLGLGRVAVVLTSVDTRWGNWAVWPSFPPLMRELTMHVAAGVPALHELRVGERLERTLPAALGRLDAAVVDPQGRRATVPLRCDAQACRPAFDATLSAGFYHLEYGPPLDRRESIAVNLDPVEALPEALDEAAIRRELLPKGKWVFGNGDDGPRLSAIGPAGRGSWSRSLLTAALGLLLIELLLTWRSAWGWAVLAGMVLGMLVWSGGAVMGLAAACLGASAVGVWAWRRRLAAVSPIGVRRRARNS